MKVNKEQIEELELNIENILKLSFDTINRHGPRTNIVLINKIAHESLKILKDKIKSP
jgi:hypothetical protein